MPGLTIPKPGVHIPPDAGAQDPNTGDSHPPNAGVWPQYQVFMSPQCCAQQVLPLPGSQPCCGGPRHQLGVQWRRPRSRHGGCWGRVSAGSGVGSRGWKGRLFLCFEPVVAAVCGWGEWVAVSRGPLPAHASPTLCQGTRLRRGDPCVLGPTGGTLSGPGLILCVLRWGPARSVGACRRARSRAWGFAGRWGKEGAGGGRWEAGSWGPSCPRAGFAPQGLQQLLPAACWCWEGMGLVGCSTRWVPVTAAGWAGPVSPRPFLPSRGSGPHHGKQESLPASPGFGTGGFLGASSQPARGQVRSAPRRHRALHRLTGYLLARCRVLNRSCSPPSASHLGSPVELWCAGEGWDGGFLGSGWALAVLGLRAMWEAPVGAWEHFGGRGAASAGLGKQSSSPCCWRGRRLCGARARQGRSAALGSSSVH